MKLRGSTQQPPRNWKPFCFVRSLSRRLIDVVGMWHARTVLRGSFTQRKLKKTQLDVCFEELESKLSCFNVLVAVVISSTSDCKKRAHAELEAVLKIEELCSFLFVFWWKEGVLNLSAAQIYPSVFQPSPELHRAASGVWFVKSPLSLFALFLVWSACWNLHYVHRVVTNIVWLSCGAGQIVCTGVTQRLFRWKKNKKRLSCSQRQHLSCVSNQSFLSGCTQEELFFLLCVVCDSTAV